MWIVYIIFNKKIKKTYVGSTDNFARRLKEHNSDKVRSTRCRGSWFPILVEFYPEEIIARKREQFLKTASGRRWMKNNIDKIIKIWLGSSVG